MEQMNYEDVEQKGDLKRHKKKTKKRVIWWKVALLTVAFAVLFFGGAVGGYVMASMYITPQVTVPPVDNEDDSLSRLKGSYNILAVGRDKVGLNTDTIMLAHIDTELNTLNIMSIPRDTMSNQNRYVKKINAAYGVGGKANIEQLKSEITDLLGVQVDRYVVVNLDAFEQVIDAIGGVTIDVPRDMKYRDPYQDLTINLSKGPQTLNGEQAIGFVRYRAGYAEGDLGRIEAQQLFIQALINQMTSPSIVNKIPELANIVKTNMDTDMTVQEMIWFAKQGLEIDLATGVNMYVLPGEAHYVWSGSQWLSYYLPFEDEILAMVNQSFNPYDTPITADMLDLVDLNKLTLRSYSGKILEKITQRNPAPSGSSNKPVTEENEASSAPEEDETNSSTTDENSTENGGSNTDNETDNNTNEQQNPSGDDSQTDNSSQDSSSPDDSSGDDSSADGGSITVITDEKGNLYEINEETGDILNVTPAPTQGDSPSNSSSEGTANDENNTQI